MLPKQLAFEFAPAPPPTLDNFVTGRNAELMLHLRRLVGPQGGERFIYVWGAPGSGRTHLLRAVAAAAVEAGTHAMYVSGTAPLSLPPPETDLGCLAVDDVERLDDTAQIGLFAIYNRLRERGAALVASGNAPPAQLALRRDLVTRLGWGLVYEVHALSDAEKVRALKQRAAERGFQLAPEVCDYLLTHASRDMPSLLALLDALDRRSLEAKRPVTVTLVREMLHALKRDEDSGVRIEDSGAGRE